MNPPVTALVPAPAEAVRLRLSGTPRLARGTQTLVLERKAAGALAWLALRGPAPRDRLALLLWPQASADAARASLRQLIYKLKRAMGCAIIDAAAELSLAHGLQLDPAGEDAPEADLLEGCEFADCPEFAQWLEQARLAHRQRGVAAGLAAAAAAEQAGDLPRALVLARRVLAGDGLCEAAHRQVMRVLYLGGDRSAALVAAAACEAALQEGLGVAPAAETRQLIESLRGPEEAPGASADTGAARPIPVTVIRPPRLIGRERERTALSHALAPGAVVVVLGEAGLGKSRLLADAVPAGALRAAGRPGDAAVPFATLARLLRPLVEALAPAARSAALRPVLPDLCGAAPLPPGGSRGIAQDLQRGVVDVLAPVLGAAGGGEGEGAVFVLDDLHHADDASVELLQAALDDDRAAAWCWVLACRPAEGGAAVRRFLGLLADEGRLVSVTLQPLDQAAVAELLVSLDLPGIDAAALAPEMTRTTGGNPLFVLETLKAMCTSGRGGGRLPRAATLGSLIERRLRLLSAPALALARVAALAGEDFSTELALQVLGTPLMDLADAWAELEAAQVLRDQAFAHDLIFEATLASVPAPIRRHARGAIAAFLEPRSAEPARVAAHWIAAGQPLRAAPLLESAARLAEASARFGESHALFEQAAAAFDTAGQPGRALAARLAIADVLMEAAQPDAAIGQLQALGAAVASADDRIAVQQQQMKVLMRLGRHDEAVDQARAALADPVLLEDATPRRLVELRFALGSCLLHHRRTAEAMLLLASLRRDFEHDPDPQQRSWFHHDHALALMRSGDLRSAQASVAVALDAAREVGRRRMVAGRLQLAAQLAEPAGRPLEAVNLLDECLLLMADSGGRDDLSEFVRMHRGGMLVLLGRYREALADLAPLHAGATRDPLRRMGTAIGLARLYGQLGQPRQALRLIDAAAAEAAHPWARHQVAVARCELAWRQGEEHGALLEAAAARMPDEPLLQERLQVLRWRAEPDAVDPTLLAERRAHWQAHGFDGHVVFADVLAARRAQRDGDAVAAARQVELALDGLRRHQPLEVCRPWICLTLAQAAAAQPALAQRALRAGVEWLQAVRRFHVPEACRDSFVEGNRVNRALWQAGSVLPGG